MLPSGVERFLTRLETEQMIGRETGQGRSIITICNYDKYQERRDEAGQATGQAIGQRPDSDRTAKEQGNKGTIDSPPKPPRGQGKTGLPEDWSAPAIADLPPQAKQCAAQWPDGAYIRHAEAFHSYWRSNGKKMADWRLTWANRVITIHDQVMRNQQMATRFGSPSGSGSTTSFLDYKLRERQRQ